MPKQNKAERQARLRTAAAPEPEQPTAKPPTRDELYQQAKAAGITGASKLNRDALVLVLAAQANGDGSAPEHTVLNPDTSSHDEPDPTTMAGRQQLGDERIAAAAQHYADTLADPDAPKALEDPIKRMMAAKGEQVALKAWQLAGKGDRPSTPNYDYIAATYVAGGEGLMPKGKRSRAASGGGGSRVRSDVGARGKAGLEEKARIKGKRGEVAREDKAVMAEYIVQMHAEHPESTALDEFRYAYWVDKRGFGKKSFLDKWAELFDGDGQAEPANDTDLDTEAGTDLPPADDVAVQVHEAAKAVAAKKAAPKKQPTKAAATKKAPAKKATGKQVNPNFKASKK